MQKKTLFGNLHIPLKNWRKYLIFPSFNRPLKVIRKKVFECRNVFVEKQRRESMENSTKETRVNKTSRMFVSRNRMKRSVDFLTDIDPTLFEFEITTPKQLLTSALQKDGEKKFKNRSIKPVASNFPEFLPPETLETEKNKSTSTALSDIECPKLILISMAETSSLGRQEALSAAKGDGNDHRFAYLMAVLCLSIFGTIGNLFAISAVITEPTLRRTGRSIARDLVSITICSVTVVHEQKLQRS